MNRSRRSRPISLAHRPKTSSAADENKPGSHAFDNSVMKRVASQTFSKQHGDCCEGQDAGGAPLPPLGAVMEGTKLVQYPASQHSQHSHSSSLSHRVSHSAKQLCRRFSNSNSNSSSSTSTSSRRPSAASILDSHSSISRKPSIDLSRIALQHQDSGIPTPQVVGEPSTTGVRSKFSSPFKRFGSIHHRRPATSGPSGEDAKFNPTPAPIPANYPVPAPGQAARASAAAANNERLSVQRREQEQTQAFLTGTLQSRHALDEVINDSESGVGMMCSNSMVRTDSVQEKKLDPMLHLPTEISDMILGELDAPTLAIAEGVSRSWREAALSPHVWKTVFLRKFEAEVHVSPTPITMGGAGIGKFKNGRAEPEQDWRTMYKVRMTINRRWKAGSPAAIYLNGHTDSVYCCQFDERKIITGSRDRTIRVWDMKTYKCIKVLGGPNNKPSPNTPTPLETHKEMVYSHPSMNGRPDGHVIFEVPDDYHDASILCLQYDDKIMVTGSSDYTCIVWDIDGIDKYTPKWRLRGHTAGVLDVCLDEKYIISCSKDASIIVWDRSTGHQIRKLTGHRGPVNAVQLRGNSLVSASGDGMAKLWNLTSGTCVKEFPSKDRGLAAVEFSDDAKYVLAGGNDHVVYKFDAMTGNLLHTSERHGGLVRSLFLDAHNGRVISGSYDQSIRVTDYHTGEMFGHYENWTTSWILSAKSDYRRVVATSQDGRALILDFGHKVHHSDQLVGV